MISATTLFDEQPDQVSLLTLAFLGQPRSAQTVQFTKNLGNEPEA
jgi:hypothetical protein